MACELVTLPRGSEAAGIGRIIRACELVASSGTWETLGAVSQLYDVDDTGWWRLTTHRDLFSLMTKREG